MALATSYFQRLDGQECPTMSEVYSVSELARLCGEETARYLRHEPSTTEYGFELFRRAIVEHDDAAWAAVHARYADLVRRWLTRWSVGAAEIDEGVAAAFERFWQAVDPAKFAGFESLAAVLQYLKKCAYTAYLDRERAARSRPLEAPLDEFACVLPAIGDVERSVVASVDRPALWRAVQQCLVDERERLVVYLSYAIGLKPREIWAQHPTRFQGVAEIYRLKRLALDRLRQAASIQSLA